jgi:hypothetical protein
MSYGLLEHFDSSALERSFAEAKRILKPGGMIVGDIAHGRFSVRTVATWLNFGASAVYHTLRGQLRKVPSLRTAYFEPFYENELGQADWEDHLRALGFVEVQVLCIRPFPPLALTGRLEGIYVRLMESAIRFYRWFDRSQSWLSRRWGWTYLFSAVKPGRPDATGNSVPLAPRW